MKIAPTVIIFPSWYFFRNNDHFCFADDDSETATEGEEEIRARELRKQEVRVEPPIVQHTDTGSDTEVKNLLTLSSIQPLETLPENAIAPSPSNSSPAPQVQNSVHNSSEAIAEEKISNHSSYASLENIPEGSPPSMVPVRYRSVENLSTIERSGRKKSRSSSIDSRKITENISGSPKKTRSSSVDSRQKGSCENVNGLSKKPKSRSSSVDSRQKSCENINGSSLKPNSRSSSVDSRQKSCENINGSTRNLKSRSSSVDSRQKGSSEKINSLPRKQKSRSSSVDSRHKGSVENVAKPETNGKRSGSIHTFIKQNSLDQKNPTTYQKPDNTPLLIIKRTPTKINLPKEPVVLNKPRIASAENIQNAKKYFGNVSKPVRKTLITKVEKPKAEPEVRTEKPKLVETQRPSFEFEPKPEDHDTVDDYIESLLAKEDQLQVPIVIPIAEVIEEEPEKEAVALTESIEDLLKALEVETGLADEPEAPPPDSEKIDELLHWMSELDHQPKENRLFRSYSDVKHKNLDRQLKIPQRSETVVNKIKNKAFFERQLSGVLKKRLVDTSLENISSENDFLKLARSNTDIQCNRAKHDDFSPKGIKGVLSRFENGDAPKPNVRKAKSPPEIPPRTHSKGKVFRNNDDNIAYNSVVTVQYIPAENDTTAHDLQESAKNMSHGLKDLLEVIESNTGPKEEDNFEKLFDDAMKELEGLKFMAGGQNRDIEKEIEAIINDEPEQPKGMKEGSNESHYDNVDEKTTRKNTIENKENISLNRIETIKEPIYAQVNKALKTKYLQNELPQPVVPRRNKNLSASLEHIANMKIPDMSKSEMRHSLEFKTEPVLKHKLNRTNSSKSDHNSSPSLSSLEEFLTLKSNRPIAPARKRSNTNTPAVTRPVSTSPKPTVADTKPELPPRKRTSSYAIRNQAAEPKEDKHKNKKDKDCVIQ